MSEMFDTMNDVEKDNFPMLFYTKMAPLTMEAPPTSSGEERLADRISGTRSAYRQDFCRSVIVRARSNFERFGNGPTWVPLYAKVRSLPTTYVSHVMLTLCRIRSITPSCKSMRSSTICFFPHLQTLSPSCERRSMDALGPLCFLP